MSTEREAALEEALSMFRESLPEKFDGEYFEGLLSSFRYLSEAVVGQSLLRLDGHLTELAARAGPDGSVSFGGLRLRKVEPTPSRQPEHVPLLTLQVLGDDGVPLYRLDWQNRAPRQPRMGSEQADWDVKDIKLFKIGPANPGYAYPERIASATVMANSVKYPGPPSARGHCTLREFGLFVDAMDVLRPCLAAPVPDDGKTYTEQETMRSRGMILDYLPMIEADGGIAGSLSREAAITVQAEVAGKVMDWAKAALPEVAAAHANRGYVWERKFLRFNDGDDSSFTIPLDPGRGVAVFHRNTSLISDYFAYVAQADMNGEGEVTGISVTALKRGTDDVRAFIESVIEGSPSRPPTIQHDFATGRTAFAEDIDTTGILDTFAFYLKFDHEMVCNGQRDGERKGDARDETDFSEFEPEEDEESDDISLSPGTGPSS